MITRNGATIAVDVSAIHDNGYKANGHASGLLFGYNNSDPAIGLVTPVGFKFHRQGVADTISNSGRDSAIGAQPIPVLSHDWSGRSVCPGDSGSWTAWDSYVDTKLASLNSAGVTPFAVDVWNEPDTPAEWPRPMSQFRTAWSRAATKIRSYGWKAVGPSLAVFSATELHAFLSAVGAVDVLSIHALTAGDHNSWRSMVGQLRAVGKYYGSANVPILLGEYASSWDDIADPGTLLGWLIAIEETRTDSSCHSIFNEPTPTVDGALTGSKALLAGLLAPGYFKRSTWWLMKYYTEMTGRVAASLSAGTMASANVGAVSVCIVRPTSAAPMPTKVSIINASAVMGHGSWSVSMSILPHRGYGTLDAPIPYSTQSVTDQAQFTVELPPIQQHTAYTISVDPA